MLCEVLPMIFRQLLNEPIAAASYLLGCAATGEAAVVDPSLPAEQYALLAADRGLRIVAVLETHLHADYISTGRALAALAGARVVLPRRAEARFDHMPVDDGETLHVGNLALTALATPGHTPEHTAYLVADTPRAERPWFALTGDCLFVGDVGRADLVDLPDTGPGPLYASIFERLLALPDDVEVFPGHYGGSACGGKAMSGKASSTIGFERRFNWALQAPDRAAFAAWVSGTPRAAVADVLRNRHTNQGLLPLPDGYGRPPAGVLPALGPAELAAAVAAGVTPLDIRPRDAFLAGHLAGALAAPYARDALVGRAAALTAPGEPVVVIGENAAVAAAAAELLAAAGRNPVAGYLAVRPEALAGAGLPAATLPRLDVDGLAGIVAAGEALVLDVRDPYEWAQGVIPGALLVSHGALRERLDELPRGRPAVVVCESGTRAALVASLLRRRGFCEVAVVAPEGMSAYAARHPTVRPGAS
jgi:hydroxyacylglutathione hydrolase